MFQSIGIYPNTTMKLINNITILALCALLTTPVLAKGLIGERNAGVGIAYTSYDVGYHDIDGYLIAGILNLPQESIGAVNIDIQVSVSHVELDYDMDAQTLGADFVLWMPMGSNAIKGFIAPGIAFTRIEGDNSTVFAIAGGIEFEVGNGLTLTPSIGISHDSDYDTDSIDYALELAYWVSESINIGAVAAYSDADDQNNTTLGAVIRMGY